MTDPSTSRRALTGPALTFLTGLDLARFQTDVWSQRPWLTAAGDRADGEPIFSLDDADELLSTRGLRTPFLRIAKDGQVLPTRRFVGGGGAGARVADQVLDERVLDEFSAGSTLVFQGLHRIWPPLQDLAGRLADELGHPVQVNAYLTPSTSRGFSAHYDTHDVFVLQIAGHKSWRCFAPPIAAPLPAQEWTTVRAEVAERAAGAPELTTTLGPGDCLYLPRGWVHEATALGRSLAAPDPGRASADPRRYRAPRDRRRAGPQPRASSLTPRRRGCRRPCAARSRHRCDPGRAQQVVGRARTRGAGPLTRGPALVGRSAGSAPPGASGRACCRANARHPCHDARLESSAAAYRG